MLHFTKGFPDTRGGEPVVGGCTVFILILGNFCCCCPVGAGATSYPGCNHKVGFMVSPRQLLQRLNLTGMLDVLLTGFMKLHLCTLTNLETMSMYANEPGNVRAVR